MLRPMSGFRERFPDVVQPSPVPDVLGERVLDPDLAPWAVFEPAQPMLVLGRSQDPHRELNVAQAQADGVPIYRRQTGGGAVILAPGMLVIALRVPSPSRDADQVFAAVNAACFPLSQR